MATNHYRFLEFQRDQDGILPPVLASQYLGISRQAVLDAKNAGKLRFIKHGNTIFYGFSSLKSYRERRAAKRGF